MTAQTQTRRDERGNALFLILIAVALFAALSYAVTQSGKSGGGGTTRETATINSGLITDYPASIRTAVTRMLLTGAAANNTVDYRTSGFGAGAATAVFDPAGGGAVAVAPPTTGIDNTAKDATHAGGAWRFKAIPSVDVLGYFVKGLGPNGDTATTGQDAFAFLAVNIATCHAINTSLGLAQAAPAETGAAMTTTADVAEDNPAVAHGAAGASAQGNANSIGKGQVAANGTAQDFGCIANGTTADTAPFIYYHTIVSQ